eukprot:GHVL01006706.1.p1 GENE.GHVL01006706.1~~GHVL01006706.1.p1  ORF type:complete len:398 (-),score=73.84 GHVL01006706.1:1237-2430(-)
MNSLVCALGAVTIGSLIVFRIPVSLVIDLLLHPSELVSILKFLKKKKITLGEGEDEIYCFTTLQKVSRSFAPVIMELHEELRAAVCIFYLVLRGLDTIEDDQTIKIQKKKEELKIFKDHLNDPEWHCIEDYGKASPHEMDLLKNFFHVSRTYQKLKPEYKDVISGICEKMAFGMSLYLTKEVATVADWDDYCYYVAGLVGVGLSRLFKASGLNDFEVENIEDLAISMGRFLQKTNIIRDYFEDICENPPRIFYPKDIWSKYVSNVADLKNSKNEFCINELVAHTLKLVPDCLLYLSMIKEPSLFRFCGIPQVMAIATLERCFNNPNVFKKCVKIRKGEAVKLMLKSTNFVNVCEFFKEYLLKIKKKVPSDDPSKLKLNVALDEGLNACNIWLSKSSQ